MLSELRVYSGTVPPDRMEVSVRIDGEQYPMTDMSHISYVNTEPHASGHYKTHEVSLNVEVERGSEK